jgi:hypothetical protein
VSPERAEGSASGAVAGGGREMRLVLAIWIPLGLLVCALNARLMVRSGTPVTLRGLSSTFVSIALTALITRGALAAARRWPLAGQPARRRNLVPHASLVLACFAVYTLLLYLAKKASYEPGWRPPNLVNFVAGQFPPVAMAYAIGAGLMAAMRLQEEIHRATLHSVRLTQQLQRAELAGIQARLRPAFFFESLDAIGSLIPRDPDAADAAVARLGTFLRYSMDVADVPEVPLEEEVHALRAYLDVLAIRSAHALSVSLSVEDEAMGASVPPLLLQPLVDDALRTAPGPGARLRIDGALRDDALVLRLSSAGAGNGNGDRPAVVDLRRRLRHLYGEGEHLSLASLPGGGEVATLVIPCVPPASNGRGTHPSE